MVNVAIMLDEEEARAVLAYAHEVTWSAPGAHVWQSIAAKIERARAAEFADFNERVAAEAPQCDLCGPHRAGMHGIGHAYGDDARDARLRAMHD